MATIRRFEDLEIWISARNLSKEVIVISTNTDLQKCYRLKDQIIALSGSVMDNIAEGFERDGNMEFRQFLSIAKGSAGELRSQIYRLYDHGFIDLDQLEKMKMDAKILSGKISNFISYLNKKILRGVSSRTCRGRLSNLKP